MAKKINFGKALMVGLKGFATGIVTGLVMLLPLWLVQYLMKQGLFGVSVLLGLGFMVLYFAAWGFFANKFWKWK